MCEKITIGMEVHKQTPLDTALYYIFMFHLISNKTQREKEEKHKIGK